MRQPVSGLFGNLFQTGNLYSYFGAHFGTSRAPVDFVALAETKTAA